VDESQLRSLGRDVESGIDLPDFEGVAARGHRIRQRRAVGAAAGVALAAVVILVGVTRGFESQRSVEPVHQPAPHVDRTGARAVLTDPDAQVDTETSRVNGSGDVLEVVLVPALGGGSSGCPNAGGRSALRWVGADGSTRAWVDGVRSILPVEDGFVVAAVPEGCRTGGAGEDRAYVVDGTGAVRGISWYAGAEEVCGTQPGDPRCRFNVTSAQASLEDDVRLPEGSLAVQTEPGSTLWARSDDSRRLFWSGDGRTWQSRASSLPGGEIVSATAAGRWGVLAGTTTVEFTRDAGRTWQTRDLSEALSPIRIGDVDWTVTRSGVLLGVTQLVGRGDVLFRSTDATWSRFVQTGVRTSFGLVRPTVVGGAVYVVDDERWLVSVDDGATWRRTPGLR
jgi:hypothetical protein